MHGLPPNQPPPDPSPDRNADPWSRADPAAFRAHLAEYLYAHRDRIRAAARDKLIPAARATTDSEDIASSVTRRLVDMADRGALEFRSEAELWALITLVAHHQAIDRGRMALRAATVALDDGQDGAQLVRALADTASDDHTLLLLHRILLWIDDPALRQLLILRLRGTSYRVIAHLQHLDENTARARWSRLTRAIREHFTADIDQRP